MEANESAQPAQRSCTAEQREEILNDAKSLGVCAASRKHGVRQPTISPWHRGAGSNRSMTDRAPSKEPVASNAEEGAASDALALEHAGVAYDKIAIVRTLVLVRWLGAASVPILGQLIWSGANVHAGPPVDVSPASAARSMLREDRAAPQTEPKKGPSAVPTASEQRAEARLAASIPGLSRASKETTKSVVDHAAQDLVSALVRPWKLLLQPLRAARYEYRDTDFDAVIRADGQVAYRNKTGLHLSVREIRRPNSKRRAVAALGLGDPHDWLEKLAGNDPQASERRSFLERTRALRELLRERAKREIVQRADHLLDEQLGRILDGRYSAREQQDTVFVLWEACGDDEVGEIARARIERFVRVRCPPGEACAFSAQDLARVNSHSRAARRFDPYAAGPPAGEPHAPGPR